MQIIEELSEWHVWLVPREMDIGDQGGSALLEIIAVLTPFKYEDTRYDLSAQ